MLEQISISVVLGAAAGGFIVYRWLTKKPVAPTAANVPRGAAPAAQAPAASPAPGGQRIGVPGALRLPALAEKPLIGLYGLRKLPFYDFCFLPGPLSMKTLHPVVASTLAQLHVQGDALGPALMECIHHERVLKEGEALYFALVGHPYQPAPRLVTFVDKVQKPAAPAS